MRDFLKSEAPHYPIEVVYATGDPIFYLIDEEGNEKESYPLIELKLVEIGQLINSKGFKRFEDN